MYREIFNRKEKKSYRSKLRNEPTKAELKLWGFLKNKQLGIKFRRQHGIGNYIVDFYAPALRLIIEMDGDTHQSTSEVAYDKMRTVSLELLGCTLIRFTNLEVYHDLESVLEKINNLILVSQ